MRTSILLLAFCCGCGGTAPERSATIEVRDELDQIVRLDAPARRICTLLPSHTQMLIALGIADRIVARDSYSQVPDGLIDVPDVGGLQPDVERLLLIAPDLILATEYETQASVLTRAGLTVYAGSPQTYDEVFRTLEAIGTLTGRRAEAESVSESLRRRVAAIESRLTDAPVRRVYFEIDATLYSVGPRSFLGTLIAKAGGQTIVPDSLPDFPQISAELVIARDPEVILGVALEEVLQRPGWSRIDAVRTRRVYALSDAERTVVVQAGPRLDEGLAVLARRIHPESLGPGSRSSPDERAESSREGSSALPESTSSPLE